MCTDPEDVRRKAHWDGASGTSRHKLLQAIQSTFRFFTLYPSYLRIWKSAYISPSEMIPQRRLAVLLEQARQYQHSQCAYHNAPPSDFTLYSDHHCDVRSFPRDTTTILDAHTDEVWAIAWSHNGKFLASGGKDNKAIIWQVGVSGQDEPLSTVLIPFVG